MQPMSIPSLTLSFLKLRDEPNHPLELIIEEQALHPPASSIPSDILEFGEMMGRFYVYSLGTAFNENVTATLIFNSDTTPQLLCEDEKAKTIFEQFLLRTLSSPSMKSQLKGRQRKIVRESKKKDESWVNFNREVLLFFETSAQIMRCTKITEPVQINLEIKGREPINEGGGLTTTCIRWPNLLKYLHYHLDDTRLSDQLHIGIVGIGLVEEDKLPPFSPQFVEIFSLCPNATFLLLDNNKHCLERMTEQFHQCKFASYDPLALRMRTYPDLENMYIAPQSYQETFEAMKDTLTVKSTKYQKNAADMLKGIGRIQRMMLEVDPTKIELRDFDINTSALNEIDKKKFNAVIGTMSITLAFQSLISENLSINYFPTLGKFLEMLKENESLYIDKMCMQCLIEYYGPSVMELGIHYIECLLGNRLKIEEIPINDFAPETLGDSITIPQFTIKQALSKNSLPTVDTHSVTVITRTSEPVSCDKEETEAVLRKLEEMLKRHDE